jgi:uncharacterized protein YraI
LRQHVLTIFSTGLLCIAADAASATGTWCAHAVQTADGFLNVRAGPSTEYAVIRKVTISNQLEIDTGVCRETLGVLQCDESRRWVFVEAIDGAFDEGNVGWVNESFLQQVECPE